MDNYNIGPKISTFRQSVDQPLENKQGIHYRFKLECLSSQRPNEHDYRGFRGQMDATYKKYQRKLQKGSPVKLKPPKLDLNAEELRFRTSS